MSYKVCARMLALKDTCIHPTTQKPYIKASSGGIDNSIEGIQVSNFLQQICLPTEYFYDTS